MGGLLLIMAYYVAYPIGWFLVWRWLFRRAKHPAVQASIGVAAVALFLPVMYVDAIADQVDLARACERDGGVKVFKRIALSKADFDENGLPRFVRVGSFTNGYVFAERFRYTWSVDNRYEGGRLARFVERLTDIHDGAVLAELVSFKTPPAGPPYLAIAPRLCPQIAGRAGDTLFRAAFFPATDK
jgi:hypothetical protein